MAGVGGAAANEIDEFINGALVSWVSMFWSTQFLL